jgi:hypothetical protein
MVGRGSHRGRELAGDAGRLIDAGNTNARNSLASLLQNKAGLRKSSSYGLAAIVAAIQSLILYTRFYDDPAPDFDRHTLAQALIGPMRFVAIAAAIIAIIPVWRFLSQLDEPDRFGVSRFRPVVLLWLLPLAILLIGPQLLPQGHNLKMRLLHADISSDLFDLALALCLLIAVWLIRRRARARLAAEAQT